MISYNFDIGEKARTVSRFISHVRSELQSAFVEEKKTRKLTQQSLATKLGVNRSVINRQLMGLENLTLRRVAEIAWALGWELSFRLLKPEKKIGDNYSEIQPQANTATIKKDHVISSLAPSLTAFKLDILNE